MKILPRLLRAHRASGLVFLSIAAMTACHTAEPVVDAGRSTTTVVKLIAINDFHGNLLPPTTPTELPSGEGESTVRVPLGGAAFLATQVRMLAAKTPLHAVVGAGDLIGASPLQSSLFRDEPTIAAMNMIGLEYSSVGNHEFDKGRIALERMQEGGCAKDGKVGVDTCIDGEYAGARFRYLAANVRDASDGEPLFPAWAAKTFTTPSGPVRVAFIGIVLQGASELVSRSGIAGLRFDDEASTINALVPQIEAQGIETIVVLIHQGGESTSADPNACENFTGDISGIVAKLDPAVDAVISAHTHRAYVCRLPSRNPDRSILVTSAGSYGRFVTDIDLQVDLLRGDVVGTRAHNVPVVNDDPSNPAPDRYPALLPDPAVAALVTAYTEHAAPQSGRVVGHATGVLDNHPDDAGESAFGEVIADSNLFATQAKNTGAAQIAFMNPGGVRAALMPDPQGNVSFGQLFNAQPFGGHLVTMTLTGAQIRAVLEAQWRANAPPHVLLPSKGFTYAWRKSLPPGQRVDPASIKFDGRDIRADGRYRVTVNDFLADGGDSFDIFVQGTDRLVATTLDRDVLAAYLNRGVTVAAPPRGRIRRLD